MKRVVIISLAAVAAICLGWYSLWERPSHARFAALRSQIVEEKQQLAAGREGMAKLGSLLHEFHSFQSGLAAPSSAAGSDEVTTLYRLLESLCQKNTYQLDQITPSLQELVAIVKTRQGTSEAASIPVMIKVRGDYRGLAGLVEEIEQSRYFHHLLGCRVTGSQEQNPSCTMEFSFAASLNNGQEFVGRE